MRRGISFWILLLAIVSCLSGMSCIRFRGPEDVRRQLSQSTGVRLDREMGLTVTRSGMWLARLVARKSSDEEISLRGVRRVQIGIYRVDGSVEVPFAEQAFEVEGYENWSPLVRVRESDAQVLVLVDDSGGSVRGLLIAVAEPDEWVLIRLKGKLDGLVEQAVAAAFEQADRPELYARTGMGGDSSLSPDPSD